MRAVILKRHVLLLGLLISGIVGPTLASAQSPGGRYALVIGNSRYGGNNDVSGYKDALAMDDHLKDLDFEVILVPNGDMAAMTKGLEDLKEKLGQASVVVFFFAGHGFQVDRQNYLVPINSGNTVDPRNSLALNTVKQTLALASGAVKLVILDACRTEKRLAEGAKQGLAEPPDLDDTLYAYATGTDETAESGSADGQSPYTTAVLRYLGEPGLTFFEILDKARSDLIRDYGQAPTQFNSGVPSDFRLRDAVFVDAEVDERVDDDLIVVLNGKVVLSAKQQLKQRLFLKAGDNDLILMVANGNSFHQGQTWERAEGWGYEMTLRAPERQKVTCLEEDREVPCSFEGHEEVPFKSGPHHGKVFTVAKANLHVNPKTAELTIKKDTKVWEREAPVKARNQGLLYEKELLKMPLEEILGASRAAFVRAVLRLVAPDPNQIFVVVRGNQALKEFVQTCMEDEEKRIPDLQASLKAAWEHNPKPFDSFDDKLSTCVEEKSGELTDSGYPAKEIKVWTALEDRHGESVPAPARIAVNPVGDAVVTRLSHTDEEERLFAIEGDAPLAKALSEKFPPIHAAPHQLAAVQATQTQLNEGLQGPLLYASLSASDLQAHLPSDLSTRFEEAEISGEVRVVGIELRDQEIVATVAFEVTPQALPIRVTGETEVHCVAAIELGALVLRSSFSTVRVTSVTVPPEEIDIEFLKPVAEEILRGYLREVLQTFETRRVPLRLQGIEGFDLAMVLARVEGVADIDAEPIDVKVRLGAAALLVDPEGIHILADAVVLTPGVFASTVDKLRQNLELNQRPQLTPDELAVLGECGEPLLLAEPLAVTFAAVCSAYAGLDPAKAPRPTVSAEEAESTFQQAFADLKQGFMRKARDIEPNIPWDRTVVAVSRTQLTKGLNEILPGVAVQATVRPPAFQAEIPPEDRAVRTPPAPDLRCDQVGGACPSVFIYPPYEPRGCPSNCSTFDFGCHAWKVNCEILKQKEKTDYEAAKTAAQAIFAADKLRCEGEKAVQQGGCRINQEWLNTVADLDVGELRGGLELREIDLPLTVDQIRLGDDFETLDLRLTAKGSGEVAGNLSVIPHNLGHLVCLAQWDSTLTAQVGLPEQQKVLHLQRTGASSEGDQLRLTYELAEIPLRLEVKPPPIKTFLERNVGQFALSCPVPTALGVLLPTGLAFALPIRNEILRDTFEVPIPARQIPIVIPSQEIWISEAQAVRIVPSWGQKSILFEAR